MTSRNRASAETLYTPISGLVPIAKWLRALAVRRVLADRADEHVADRGRCDQAGSPDLPVCNGRKMDAISRHDRARVVVGEFGLPDFVYVWL